MVTELCAKDLGDLIKDKKAELSLYEKLMLARDICRGMAWLHHLGVLHLDLKPENLLVIIISMRTTSNSLLFNSIFNIKIIRVLTCFSLTSTMWLKSQILDTAEVKFTIN